MYLRWREGGPGCRAVMVGLGVDSFKEQQVVEGVRWLESQLEEMVE